MSGGHGLGSRRGPGRLSGATLLFNVVHDGEDGQLLKDLAAVLRSAVGDALGLSTDQGLVALFAHDEVPHPTLFIANINTKVADVHAEDTLWRFLRDELDRGLTVRPSTTFLGADRRFHAERRNEGANDDISRFRTQMYLA